MMAEPDPTPDANGTPSALERLRSMMKEPLRSSGDFAATSSRKPVHLTNSYRTLAAAPPSGDPAPVVNLDDIPKKSRKRKVVKDADEGPVVKKKRGPKAKKEAATAVVKSEGKKKKKAEIPELPAEVWVRIAEFSDPKDFVKLCLISRKIGDALMHWQGQVRLNQIIQTFPPGMPQTFPNLSDRQYAILLGRGKGCTAPGCKDKKALKTYWPWARRLCAKCYEKKTIKWRDVHEKYRNSHGSGDHGVINISLLLSCIPHGICDSYNKAHCTLTGDFPYNRTPKLHKICEVDAIEELIQQWKDFMPKEYERDPNMTDAENAAALIADKQMRDERSLARNTHFMAMMEENNKYMEVVVKIEEGIAEKRKNPQSEAKALRERKMTTFLAYAADQLPDIPSDIVRKLKCVKDARRTPCKKPDRAWRILKPKIVKEFLENPNPTPSSSASTTPAPSIEAFTSTPDPETPSSSDEIPSYGSFQRSDSTPSLEISRSSTPSMSMSSYGSRDLSQPSFLEPNPTQNGISNGVSGAIMNSNFRPSFQSAGVPATRPLSTSGPFLPPPQAQLGLNSQSSFQTAHGLGMDPFSTSQPYLHLPRVEPGSNDRSSSRSTRGSGLMSLPNLESCELPPLAEPSMSRPRPAPVGHGYGSSQPTTSFHPGLSSTMRHNTMSHQQRSGQVHRLDFTSPFASQTPGGFPPTQRINSNFRSSLPSQSGNSLHTSGFKPRSPNPSS